MALREFAPRWNMEIVAEYLDDGVSGTIALDKRPEGLRMMEDAKSGRFSVVLFYKTDRLARSLRYLLDAVDYFDSVNVALKCASEPFETETPVGRMIVQMMGSFAEMERGMILERTTAGRNRVAAQGKWVGGPIPYGYKLDGEGMLMPNWSPRDGYSCSEAEIVQRIFKWIGTEQSSTINTAKRLNDQGVPMWRKYQTRGHADLDYHSTVSGAWMPTTITCMVRSPIYKGVHIYKGGIERPVTPLVDQAIWDSAQAQLLSNRNLSIRETDTQYLLRGFITCADCGAAYSGSHKPKSNGSGDTNLYYRCGSQISSRRAATGVFCGSKLVRADWIEDMVWTHVKEFVMNPETVLKQLKVAMESELADVPKIAERRKELERTLRAKESENDRMINTYPRAR